VCNCTYGSINSQTAPIRYVTKTWSVVLLNNKTHILLSQVYCVRHVVKTPTIILNNPVLLPPPPHNHPTTTTTDAKIFVTNQHNDQICVTTISQIGIREGTEKLYHNNSLVHMTTMVFFAPAETNLLLTPFAFYPFNYNKHQSQCKSKQVQ
jgi:hypothetical protein